MIRTKPFNFAMGVNKKFVYTGLLNAITATGGFAIEDQIKTMQIQVVQNIAKYDVTDSIQILYDLNTLNTKLGNYNNSTNLFEMDSIMICAAEFINGLTSYEQINSVGNLNNMYKNFVDYVNKLLNYEEGFSCIYLMDEQFEVEKEQIGIKDLFETLIKTSDNIYGTYNDLYGNITINGTNKLLKYMKRLNLFGNREGVEKEGFIEGDLIYVPYGLTISVRVDLDAENLELNQQGIDYVKKLNDETDYDTGTSSQQTIVTSENVIRVIKTPLLIKLADLSNIHKKQTVPSVELPSVAVEPPSVETSVETSVEPSIEPPSVAVEPSVKPSVVEPLVVENLSTESNLYFEPKIETIYDFLNKYKNELQNEEKKSKLIQTTHNKQNKNKNKKEQPKQKYQQIKVEEVVEQIDKPQEPIIKPKTAAQIQRERVKKLQQKVEPEENHHISKDNQILKTAAQKQREILKQIKPEPEPEPISEIKLVIEPIPEIKLVIEPTPEPISEPIPESPSKIIKTAAQIQRERLKREKLKKTQQNIIVNKQNIVELPKPVIELPQPVVELPQPVVELPQPVVELPQPVVELPQPVVEPQIVKQHLQSTIEQTSFTKTQREKLRKQPQPKPNQSTFNSQYRINRLDITNLFAPVKR